MTGVDDHIPDRLSWSRIRSYLTCSLQYAFRHVSKEKPEFTPGAFAFGSAAHRAMEEALVGRMAGQEVPIDHLVGVFGASLDEAEAEAPIRWSEKESRESATAQARAMLDVWLAQPRAGKILAVEESFEVELAPWLRLSGRVDVVEESEDGQHLLLTDLKTSRTAWGEEQVLQGQDQLVLYREGLRPLIEAVGKPVKLGWEVLLKQKTPRVERIELADPPTAERAIRTATIVQEAISKQIYVPSAGIQCHGCPFRSACRRW